MNDVNSQAPVFRGMTRAELDRQYNNRAYLPNSAELIARYEMLSRPIREMNRSVRLSYGVGPSSALDLYRPADTSTDRLPVHVFVHGGAWQSQSAAESAFVAPSTLAAPGIFVALDFDLVPDARLPSIVEQVQGAIAWLARNVAAHGGDPDQIMVSGHSSGGHLAAMLLTTDWTRYGLPADLIKAGIVVSGMYDLEPVRLTYRNELLKLTPEEAAALSPIRFRPTVVGPILVAVSENETDEFRRQARDVVTAWRDMGADVRFLQLDGLNHFNCIETIADASAPLGESVVRFLRRNRNEGRERVPSR